MSRFLGLRSYERGFVNGRSFTLSEFYAVRARADSEERSFGGQWADGSGGVCQVAWVRNTGELYVSRISTDFGTGEDTGHVILDVVGAFLYGALARGSRRKRAGEVEVVAVVPDETSLAGLLAGWEEHERSASGLDWLRSRARSASGA